LRGEPQNKTEKKSGKKVAKAHRPAPFVGRREVAGYETPVGFLRSAEGARIERVTSLLLDTRISFRGRSPRPPKLTTGRFGGTGDMRIQKLVYKGWSGQRPASRAWKVSPPHSTLTLGVTQRQRKGGVVWFINNSSPRNCTPSPALPWRV